LGQHRRDGDASIAIASAAFAYQRCRGDDPE